VTNDTQLKTRKRRDWWFDLQKLLAKLSPHNRETATPIMNRLRNTGIKPNSIYAHGMALLHADRSLKGKPFAEATQEDLVHVVTDLKVNLKGTTPAIYASLLRRFWMNLLGLDDLDDLPGYVKKGLACRRGRKTYTGSVLSDTQLQAILDSCKEVMTDRVGIATPERNATLFRTLRRTGFRISECLALRNGTVSFEEGDLVRLELPHDAPDLKTGPRTVIIHEPDHSLRNWIRLHPTPDDPKAPLFPTNGGSKVHLPLAYKSCADLFKALQNHANVRDKHGNRFSLHDLRHTCATEKARLRWSEEQMSRFFGWAPGSSMPSVYIHLNLDDMRAQVAADAKLAPATPRTAAHAGILDALAELLRQQGVTGSAA
jgi:integrase